VSWFWRVPLAVALRCREAVTASRFIDERGVRVDGQPIKENELRGLRLHRFMQRFHEELGVSHVIHHGAGEADECNVQRFTFAPQFTKAKDDGAFFARLPNGRYPIILHLEKQTLNGDGHRIAVSCFK
jgi:hypothetical protein